DAAHLAPEVEAVVAVAAFPALLRLLGDGIEPLGYEVGRTVGLRRRLHQLGVEGAGDSRLLDDSVRIARVQPIDQRNDAARLIGDGAEVLTSPLFARSGDENGLLKAGVDEELLQRGLVLEI